MRQNDPEHEEPLDLGLFEIMMGMTPQEWDGIMPGDDDDALPPKHDHKL